MLSSSTSIVAAKETVFSDLGGEVAILDLRTGQYFGLNAVGAFVWQLLQSPRTLQEICRAVEGSFEVEPERCAVDVMNLVGELHEAGLVDLGEEA